VSAPSQAQDEVRTVPSDSAPSSALLAVRDLARTFTVRTGGSLWGQPGLLRAVDGVSFRVKAGSTLGLVGESGCGKSTTARLVLGLLAPTRGDVYFEGSTVPSRRGAAWRALRRRMQMVYQDPLGALDRRLPVVEQVAEPLVVFGMGTAAGRLEQARELMAAVGLTANLFDRYPHELSGGQRQRVVLARALILRPSLLVCDEPISALDVSIQAQVINLLQDVQERFGVAFLFISHDLKVVRQVSEEVAVMYLGRIVEQGRPEVLFHRPAHPYTQALVSAIPSPWRRDGAQRIVLQGDPPNPSNVPAGCAFHPRCAAAKAMCREQRPALVNVGHGRLAACHLLPAVDGADVGAVVGSGIPTPQAPESAAAAC
jgi:peptide/nickel transport system ATP-binding protein